MQLPPDAILVGAKRWLELLPVSGGIRRAQTLLTTYAEYSDLTPTQYATALTLLRDLGLLAEIESPVRGASQVLSSLLERDAPTWVRDADELVQSPDELPADILAAGKALGLEDEEVFSQLVSSWGKVDMAARRRVGDAGEIALVEGLRSCRDRRVDHVAAFSDGFGYDIAVAEGSVTTHLEVKSTNRVGRFTAYLSRHEHSVMLRDDRWVLVVVRLTIDLELAGVGWVPSDWIAANVPRDEGVFGSWASAKLNIPNEVIRSVNPELMGHKTVDLPPW